MTTLFYAGAEIPGWRKLLYENGVRHMALSFVGLSRRTNYPERWKLVEKFPEDVHIFVESGGHSINKNPDKYDVPALMDSYLKFVEANVDRVHTVTELDARVFEPEMRQQLRDRLHELSGNKFLPIWHEDDGVEVLVELATVYGRVGVPQVVASNRDLTPLLMSLARQGVRLHGVAMTQMDAIMEIPWDSVLSTSWLSPAQYGDTIVWTGNELKRYPRRYKEQARRRHRAQFLDAGFDPDLIESDDVTECLRLSIWSWQRFMEFANERRSEVVTTSENWHGAENAELPPNRLDIEPVESGNSGKRLGGSRKPSNRRDGRRLLPGVRIAEKRVRELTDSGEVTKTIRLLDIDDQPIRSCDGCFLADKCPQYQPDTECAFELPVEARTRDQLARIQEILIEIQTQRILLARFAEECNGGYLDANLSREIDRLQRMLKIKEDMDREGFTLTVRAQATQHSQMGLIGRIFGKEASQAARALEAPVKMEDVAAQLGIVDAELVDQ